MMYANDKPLFTLTTGEFTALIKLLVEKAIDERQQEQPSPQVQNNDEHFDIMQLAKFLHCSKMSVHNYKKMGMPFYRIGRKVLFKKTEVLSFMRMLRNKANERKRNQ